MDSRLFVVVSILSLTCISSSVGASAPIARALNGTYVGKHVESYNQDLFLGVPFAQPPVGELRFQNPQSLNASFDTRDATEYADSCVGYGFEKNSPAWPHTMSEDCLTLNIVRPSKRDCGSASELLPVGVFIHGGGWSMDYSANGVYNLSFIVEESVNVNKPIMAVSVDYRLSFWGFMASQEMLDDGVANLGLKDQRIALHWIQENIAAFGGDPTKVTIWGESAGGGNVGFQATAYGGRDDSLFRGLISQSGADGTQMGNLTMRQVQYDAVVRTVGCDGRDDTLACLRAVPFDQLNATITEIPGGFSPFMDGDFIPDYPSTLLDEGKFTNVPFLLGTNADEATMFAGTAIDNDEDVRNLLNSGQDENTTTILMALYPNVDSLGLPAHYRVESGGPVGAQYKRGVALLTDQMFLSWTRMRSEAWSKHGVPAYTYLFESPGARAWTGTMHFAEIGYVFYNQIGLGYGEGQSPLENATQEVLGLAKLTTRMWISFIHDLDPNNHGVDAIEQWPSYNATGGYGQAFYLHPDNAGAIPDTFRLAGTTFMNAVAREQFGR